MEILILNKKSRQLHSISDSEDTEDLRIQVIDSDEKGIEKYDNLTDLVSWDHYQFMETAVESCMIKLFLYDKQTGLDEFILQQLKDFIKFQKLIYRRSLTALNDKKNTLFLFEIDFEQQVPEFYFTLLFLFKTYIHFANKNGEIITTPSARGKKDEIYDFSEIACNLKENWEKLFNKIVERKNLEKFNKVQMFDYYKQLKYKGMFGIEYLFFHPEAITGYDFPQSQKERYNGDSPFYLVKSKINSNFFFNYMKGK